MMKIDVCIISGNFIENPKLVFNLNFHVIFSFQVIESIFTFPFLTVRFLLFQNSSDPDVHSLNPHPPPPLCFLKEGGMGVVNFITSTKGGRDRKIKKRGGSMVQGQVFSKRWYFFYLIFQDHIYVQKLSFAKLCDTPLQNRAMHLKKIIFFCHHNFGEKNLFYISCLNMNLKIFKKLR